MTIPFYGKIKRVLTIARIGEVGVEFLGVSVNYVLTTKVGVVSKLREFQTWDWSNIKKVLNSKCLTLASASSANYVSATWRLALLSNPARQHINDLAILDSLKLWHDLFTPRIGLTAGDFILFPCVTASLGIPDGRLRHCPGHRRDRHNGCGLPGYGCYRHVIPTGMFPGKY